MGFPGVATYSATKFAVVGFTEAVALEHAGTGIEFTCVMPGLVKTQLATGLSDHWLLKASEPDDVAAAIIGAVRRGRRNAYVPRRLGPITSMYAAMSGRMRSRAMKVLGADHQILDAATPDRDAYERRIQAG